VTALITEGNKQFVYVVNKDSKAEKREITAGAQVGNMQIIEAGLKGDETVISGGLNKVRPNAPVKAVLDK
jgi:multidrug efflux pump subunit AcrA (membrane-fusion protein)